jgi:hypothetical protein
MTFEQIEKLYNAQPFQPFVIHLADGEQLNVPSREYIAGAPTGWTLVVFDAQGVCSLVDVAQITRVEIKPPVPKQRKR